MRRGGRGRGVVRAEQRGEAGAVPATGELDDGGQADGEYPDGGFERPGDDKDDEVPL